MYGCPLIQVKSNTAALFICPTTLRQHTWKREVWVELWLMHGVDETDIMYNMSSKLLPHPDSPSKPLLDVKEMRHLSKLFIFRLTTSRTGQALLFVPTCPAFSALAYIVSQHLYSAST